MPNNMHLLYSESLRMKTAMLELFEENKTQNPTPRYRLQRSLTSTQWLIEPSEKILPQNLYPKHVIPLIIRGNYLNLRHAGFLKKRNNKRSHPTRAKSLHPHLILIFQAKDGKTMGGSLYQLHGRVRRSSSKKISNQIGYFVIFHCRKSIVAILEYFIVIRA
jgi:hypothetical protein